MRLEVLDAVKGQTGKELTIVVPGGTVGDLTFRLDSVPSFTPGETDLLFLDARGQVVGGPQGKMSVVGEVVPSLGEPVGEVLSSIAAVASGNLESRSNSMTLPAGLVSNAPPIRPDQTAFEALPLVDGFESGLGLWTRSGSPTWGATSYRAAAGSYSAYCMGSSVPAPGPYPNDAGAWMIAGPYDLSTATAATLEYDQFLNTEVSYDWCYAWASLDGSFFSGSGWSGNSGGWVPGSLDLSAVPNGSGGFINMVGDSSVWVAFYFKSDFIVNDEGAYIDNVQLVTDDTPLVIPAITNISPSSGSAGTDTEVTITGTGFGATQDSGRVEFLYKGTERMSAPIISWSDTIIVCVIPTDYMSGGYPGSAASGPVTVVNSGGKVSSSYAFLVTFGYGGAKWNTPICTYYVNANTPDIMGEESLIDSAAATWNPESVFKFVDGGSTSATTWTLNGANEVFWSSSLPSGVLAAAGYWTSGSSMVEADISFSEAYSWGTGSGTTYDIWTIGLHEFGHWLVLRDLYGSPDFTKVMYGYGSSGVQKRGLHADDSEGIVWIYGGSVEAPTISSLDPTSGPTVGGTSVTITGTNFTGLSGASAVTFGGTDATDYNVNSSTQITATAPAHSAGTVQVQVTAAGGSTSNTATDDYTYVAAGVTWSSYRGSDRYDTAVKLSKAAYLAVLPAGSGLVLAPGESFQEALCGGPLAAAYGGPVLLNQKTSVNGAVMAEIRRLAPQTVFCIGYSTTMVTAIRRVLPGITVTPINGTNVYDMSYRVAKALAAKAGTANKMTTATAVITIGTNYPDALGVAPLACAKLWPILLTGSSSQRQSRPGPFRARHHRGYQGGHLCGLAGRGHLSCRPHWEQPV